MTSDADGRVLLGRCPFDQDGSIDHSYGLANGTLIMRVDYYGAVGYGFLSAADFNLEYWRGHTQLGRHELLVDLIGEPDIPPADGKPACKNDFDGDDVSDVAVVRPGSSLKWYLRVSNYGSPQSIVRSWGDISYGNIPVHGDFDGDGITDIAVYRPGLSSYWYFLKSSTGFTAYISQAWGTVGDLLTARAEQ